MEADVPVAGGLFQMRAGPHRACGIVQHLGGHRAQKETPEWPVSMRRHHDEAGAVGVRAVDDLAGRVAPHYLPGHGNIGALARPVSGEFAFPLLQLSWVRSAAVE